LHRPSCHRRMARERRRNADQETHRWLAAGRNLESCDEGIAPGRADGKFARRLAITLRGNSSALEYFRAVFAEARTQARTQTGARPRQARQLADRPLVRAALNEFTLDNYFRISCVSAHSASAPHPMIATPITSGHALWPSKCTTIA